MRRHPSGFNFRSPLAELMEQYVREKRTCGCRYESENASLHAFDRFLVATGLLASELPRPLMDRWTAKRPGERPRTQQWRIGVARGFARFLRREGVEAYVPEARVAQTAHRRDFIPYVFSREQMRQLLQAVDALPPSVKSPLRRRVMPEVFRLLYGCGLRVSEAVNLRVDDVDLPAGVLTIRDAKFGKDRLVPVAASIAVRLRSYAANLGARDDEMPFFPAPGGGHYGTEAVYLVFRDLLRACNIGHGGRGRGPRLHDLRATFAVHRLEAWYRRGEDLRAVLPVLAVYMGHDTLAGTQWYLRLTPELYPDVTSGLEVSVGHVIPGRTDQ